MAVDFIVASDGLHLESQKRVKALKKKKKGPEMFCIQAKKAGIK